jgi:phage-related baseplate assembly protein
MNIAAAEVLSKAEDEMKTLLSEVQMRLGSDTDGLALLETLSKNGYRTVMLNVNSIRMTTMVDRSGLRFRVPKLPV